MVEGDGRGDAARQCGLMAGEMQRLAAALGARGCDGLAVELHGLALRVRDVVGRAELAAGRGSACASCASGLGDPPEPGCKWPCRHAREDGTSYAPRPEPPPSVDTAVASFLDEHLGLPWLGHVSLDAERGVIVVGVRRRGASVAGSWRGVPLEMRDET